MGQLRREWVASAGDNHVQGWREHLGNELTVATHSLAGRSCCMDLAQAEACRTCSALASRLGVVQQVCIKISGQSLGCGNC